MGLRFIDDWVPLPGDDRVHPPDDGRSVTAGGDETGPPTAPTQERGAGRPDRSAIQLRLRLLVLTAALVILTVVVVVDLATTGSILHGSGVSQLL